MTSEQGGAIANRQGNILEQQVRQAFASHGFREVAFAEYKSSPQGGRCPASPFLICWCGGCLTSPSTGTGG